MFAYRIGRLNLILIGAALSIAAKASAEPMLTPDVNAVSVNNFLNGSMAPFADQGSSSAMMAGFAALYDIPGFVPDSIRLATFPPPIATGHGSTMGDGTDSGSMGDGTASGGTMGDGTGDGGSGDGGTGGGGMTEGGTGDGGSPLPVVTPEPATFGLFGAALLGFGALKFRRSHLG